MGTQYVETLIIGAGQAGLSTGYHLKRRGRQFVIVDANARVGDNWREQWDTLRLYTPAKYDKLPGLPFPAARWHCPQKDEVGDYLEQYALRFDLPVRATDRLWISPTSRSVTARSLADALSRLRQPYHPRELGAVEYVAAPAQ